MESVIENYNETLDVSLEIKHIKRHEIEFDKAILTLFILPSSFLKSSTSVV